MRSEIDHCILQNSIDTLVVDAISEILVNLIDGYVISYYMPQNGFDIRIVERGPIVLSLYGSVHESGRVLLSGFSRQNNSGQQKCVDKSEFDFNDPKITPAFIAEIIAWLVNNQVDYDDAVDIYDKEEDCE